MALALMRLMGPNGGLLRTLLFAALAFVTWSNVAEARRHQRPGTASSSHAHAERASAHRSHSSSRSRASSRSAHRSHSYSHSVVHVATSDPWSPYYVAPTRSGYVWVSGSYHHGHYVPGHWRPTSSPGPDMVWVPGYWDGYHYVDGYWRPLSRSGYVWTSGHYDGGTWVSGTWTIHGASVGVGLGSVDIEVHAPHH